MTNRELTQKQADALSTVIKHCRRHEVPGVVLAAETLGFEVTSGPRPLLRLVEEDEVTQVTRVSKGADDGR